MNINYVLKNIKNPDVKIRKINNLVYIIFIESICNTSVINDFIVKPIIKYKINNMKDLNNNIYNSQKIKIYDYKKFYKLLYSGFCIICINNKFIGFETKGTLDSGILVSTNEKSIKGPKDAFTENYQINIGLIRKRIRSNNLVIKEMTIGKDSITNISMIYINNNIFPTTLSTERPDLASFSIMKGKIIIIVENSPQVLVLPTFFIDHIKTQDDYYQNSKNITITRIIRFIALILSILVPSLYLALTTFNQETLPLSLLINFSMQREGIPFPSFIEALLLWLIFEILKESDTRIPYVFGTSMSIVGALVLGDASVSAGLISPIMIIIISISAISTFLFSDNDMVNSLRFYKLLFLLLSSIVGIYGIFISSLILIIKLCNMKSYDYDYINFENKKDLFDSLILSKKYKFNKRESYLTKNIKRR